MHNLGNIVNCSGQITDFALYFRWEVVPVCEIILHGPLRIPAPARVMGNSVVDGNTVDRIMEAPYNV